MQLSVGALEVRICKSRRSAVARADDENRIEITCSDQPVHVGIDEVEPRRRAPMAEKPRLDVVGFQGFFEKGVVDEVDLSDGEIIGRTPVGVDEYQLAVRDGYALLAGAYAHGSVLRVSR